MVSARTFASNDKFVSRLSVVVMFVIFKILKKKIENFLENNRYFYSVLLLWEMLMKS